MLGKSPSGRTSSEATERGDLRRLQGYEPAGRFRLSRWEASVT